MINDVTSTKTVELTGKSDKNTDNDCYNIPIKIQLEVCKNDVHWYRNTCSNIILREQKCHFKPMKICELEIQTSPEKAKKHSDGTKTKNAGQEQHAMNRYLKSDLINPHETERTAEEENEEPKRGTVATEKEKTYQMESDGESKEGEDVNENK